MISRPFIYWLAELKTIQVMDHERLILPGDDEPRTWVERVEQRFEARRINTATASRMRRWLSRRKFEEKRRAARLTTSTTRCRTRAQLNEG